MGTIEKSNISPLITLVVFLKIEATIFLFPKVVASGVGSS